jgi:hypothetical protein
MYRVTSLSPKVLLKKETWAMKKRKKREKNTMLRMSEKMPKA